MRVDARNAFGADDAVDVDHRLLAGVRVMAPTEHRDLRARFPADLIGGVVQHGLLQLIHDWGSPWADSFRTFTMHLLE
jgi:hypothetical protein